VRLQLLLLDGVFDTGLASLLDCMAIANVLGPDLGASSALARVGVRSRVATAQGHAVRMDAKVSLDTLPDVLVVPALGCLTPETLGTALERPDVIEASRFIAKFSAAGVQIATACTGTFVVAMSGILDGLLATTTWWLEPMFRETYPSVQVDASRMLVEQPGVVTAGAALGHVDLALWLVRQMSPQLAQTTARYLLFDDRKLQASYAMADHLAHDDPIVTKFEAWARAHLRAFSIEKAARAVGASQRTLQRRIQRVLGRTPIAYVRDIRVQQAIHRLRTSDATLDEIAEEVGYTDAVTLRTVLRKKTGRGVRELRGGL
jgi:transcriptional regulator GlxA family with amidase domain